MADCRVVVVYECGTRFGGGAEVVGPLGGRSIPSGLRRNVRQAMVRWITATYRQRGMVY